jgi:hypothetical protein
MTVRGNRESHEDLPLFAYSERKLLKKKSEG